MSTPNNITCPPYSHLFDANTQLHPQIEAGIEEKYNQKLAEKESHYQQEENAFQQLQADLDKEKHSMARIWKQREKQLQKVLLNITHMYGSLKGIAGTAVASVALLEI